MCVCIILGIAGVSGMGLNGVGVLKEVNCVSHQGDQGGRLRGPRCDDGERSATTWHRRDEMLFSTNFLGLFGHPFHRSRAHQAWDGKETRADAVARPRAGKGVAPRVSK